VDSRKYFPDSDIHGIVRAAGINRFPVTYCLSKTPTLLSVCPLAFVPFVLKVITVPFLDITR
jgi:hypothetical protein